MKRRMTAIEAAVWAAEFVRGYAAAHEFKPSSREYDESPQDLEQRQELFLRQAMHGAAELASAIVDMLREEAPDIIEGWENDDEMVTAKIIEACPEAKP